MKQVTGVSGLPSIIFLRPRSVYEVEIETMGGFLFMSSFSSRWAEIIRACKVLYFLPFHSHVLCSRHTEFPRKPTGVLKEHLATEADNRLGCYLPMPEPEQPPDPNLPPIPERPKLPEDVVDAPLVRIYNFLRKYPSPRPHKLYWLIWAVEMMSRSYQLEILWYQVCYFFQYVLTT